MALIRYEQTNSGAPAVFAYAGAGWTGGNVGNQTIADQQASGATYATTTNVGDTLTITVAGGNAKTGIILGGAMSVNGATAIGVSVDGVAQAVWNQNTGTGAAAVSAYTWYQSTYKAISWAATDPTGASTHTIVITAAAGTTIVDFCELVDTTTAVVPQTISVVGHSQAYALTENNPLIQTKINPNAASLVALWLGGYTVTNLGLPGEDLTNGSIIQVATPSTTLGGTFTIIWTPANGAPVLTTAATAASATIATINANLTAASIPWQAVGTTGVAYFSLGTALSLVAQNSAAQGTLTLGTGSITGGTLTIANPTNTPFLTNGYTPEPGFRRLASGTGVVTRQKTWGNNAFQEAYASGGWDARPEILLVWHGYNDRGYPVYYDVPQNPPTAAAQSSPPYSNNGATSAFQVQVMTASVALTGGTFTLTGPDAGGVARTTGATSWLASVLNIQSILDAAGIVFTASGAGGSPLATGPTPVTFTAQSAKAQANNMIVTPSGLTPGGATLTMAAANPIGRDTRAAGAGWTVARFKQRYRELLWRRQLTCPKGITICCGIIGDNTCIADPYTVAINAAIQAACADPSVTNAYYVDLYNTLNNAGGKALYTMWQQAAFAPGTQSAHPTTDGHALIALEIARVIAAAKRPAVAARIR